MKISFLVDYSKAEFVRIAEKLETCAFDFWSQLYLPPLRKQKMISHVVPIDLVVFILKIMFRSIVLFFIIITKANCNTLNWKLFNSFLSLLL